MAASGSPETTRRAGVAGTLLAVNVGLPREIAWEGRTVRTAIWKQPVEGPVTVGRLNLAGDRQADLRAHGGEHRAVYVYQRDSYRHWAEQLGRDDFVDGQFGENLTVEGLADDEVCIGDRLRIGSALFEVTQPRVTCYRLAIRMDETRMPSLLVAHRRPGFYLRVIEEGVIERGDAIEQVAAGPQQMTVAEIDALLYLPRRSRHDLQRATRIPALSEGWRGSFEQLLAEADAAAAQPQAAEAWPGFRTVRVTAVERESAEISSFWLRPVDDGEHAVPPAQPGQYLMLRVPDDADPGAAPLIRCYSLSTLPDERGYRISVKREGRASRHLHAALAVGATIDAAAPRGQFVLGLDDDRPIALISAGVGATPVLAMLHALAERGQQRRVWWIHTARDRQHHAFAAEVDGLLARLPDARRVVAYTGALDPRDASGEFDHVGRLSPALLAELDLPREAAYFLCGPTGFMDDVSAALTSRGVPPERVRSERFGAREVHASGVVVESRPPPHPPAGPVGTGPQVTFARSGLAVRWRADEASLLDFAEACDVPANFGCRAGVCQSCRTGVLAGSIRYAQQPLDAPEDDSVLLCCAVPESDLVLDL